jgi:hypothetical protein
MKIYYQVQFCFHRDDPYKEASWHTEIDGIFSENKYAEAEACFDQAKIDHPKQKWRVLKTTLEVVKS